MINYMKIRAWKLKLFAKKKKEMALCYTKIIKSLLLFNIFNKHPRVNYVRSDFLVLRLLRFPETFACNSCLLWNEHILWFSCSNASFVRFIEVRRMRLAYLECFDTRMPSRSFWLLWLLLLRCLSLCNFLYFIDWFFIFIRSTCSL